MPPEIREQVNPYDVLASVYAHHFGHEASRVLAIYDQLVLSHLAPTAHILDICCGTGQLARDLTARGSHVVGIDNSEHMLDHARRLAPRAKFLRANVLDFQLPIRFDAALSTFNSFAHLHSAQELSAAFKNIKSVLRDGSPFAFDLYMESAYIRRWHGYFEVSANRHLCRVSPTYDPARKLATNDIQIFDSSKALQRSLTMTQHCFSQQTIEAALTGANFNRVQMFDAAAHFGFADEAGRAFFLAYA